MRRQSPYMRLVRNRNFSLLWIGQLVSLFGERIHTVAIGFLVYDATGGGVMEVGLTMAATAIPNVLLGPLAGTLVDRWNRRWTMFACDLVRAALLVAVPFVLAVDIRLVYLIAFLIATVTLLFRPAKTAVIPAIVEQRDLVTANSMSTVADTAADLLGLPLAGVLVGVLRQSDAMTIAFAIGSVTYVVSAIFIFVLSVPRQELVTTRFSRGRPLDRDDRGLELPPGARPSCSATRSSRPSRRSRSAPRSWRSFPTREQILDQSRLNSEAAYALLLTGIAVGSVVGGLAIGAIGERVAKGPIIIAGFVGMGLSLAAAGFVTDPFVAIGLFFVRRAVQHALHRPDHHALPAANAAGAHGPRRLEPAGVRVRGNRAVDGPLRLPGGDRRRRHGPGHRRWPLRAGRRLRAADPCHAQRPVSAVRATLRAPWD